MIYILTILSFISLHLWADTSSIYEADKKGISLTEQDKRLLEIGEISDTRYIVGEFSGLIPLGLVSGMLFKAGGVIRAGFLRPESWGPLRFL